MSKILSRGLQKQPKRGWNCPSDGVLAAYVDHALNGTPRDRLQVHLAGCAYCRGLVADVVKLQRVTDVPPTPPKLVRRASALVPSNPRPWVWSWASLAAAGVLVCTVTAVRVVQTPQTLTFPHWPAPTVPALSKSEASVPTTATPERETV